MQRKRKFLLTGFVTIQLATLCYVLLRNPLGRMPDFARVTEKLNALTALEWSSLEQQLNLTNTSQYSSLRNRLKHWSSQTITNIVLKNDFLSISSRPGNRIDEYPYRSYNTSCRRVSRELRKRPLAPGDARKVLEWYRSIDDYFTPHRTDPINFPEDEGENLFLSYDYNKPSTHTLPDTQVAYFHLDGDKISCYKRGTAEVKHELNGTVCVCQKNFSGALCSIPQSVADSQKYLKGKYVFEPRKVPRRVLFAMTFNMEHLVLYLKMLQNADAVDLFLILEGNVTNYGDPKPIYLLPALKRGFMRRWHHKIMHMFTSEFLPEARVRGKGFKQEHHLRGLFAPAILQRVKNVRQDDLFVFFDADEAPGLDELLFLKLHDGYPFPVGFHMSLYRYGMYWWDKSIQWAAVGVASVEMFFNIYSGNANRLRGHIGAIRNKQYKNFGGSRCHEVWYLGSVKNCVGWHLSFFGTPGQVLKKIVSVINGDWPRWADNPVNRNITYIATLFRRGRFFDLKSDFVSVCPQYIPQFKDLHYIFKYPNYFNHLLVNPNLFIP